ncbi:MAG: GntR family transcriptional regulator [Chloroflexi bacterium]|nr:GntR family transcriptional regulator [Chloroflexota bacterium]
MVGASSLFPITKQASRTSDFVFEALSKSIVEGEMRPGQRLREVEIAAALGVSRTPLREALVQLERQHLVRHQINGAYFIAEWDKKTLWEVATLRGALESLAISLAISNIDQEDISYLETVKDSMGRTVKNQDYDKLILLDIQFHNYIWSRAGHILLQESLTRMKPQIRYFMLITKRGDEESYPTTHRQLINVLKQGDPIKAKEAMRKHILDTAAHLISQLDID